MSISLPKEIIEDLRNHNPFDRPAVVKGQNIWGDSFPDVSILNAHASDAVLTTLERVENSTSSLDKVLSVVITADRGVGKSHLIRRIRKQSNSLGNIAFIYASADEYSDLDFINSAFLRSLAESLDKPISDGITQWQMIAYLMLKEALKIIRSNIILSSPKEMINKFDKLVKSNLSKNKNLVPEIAKILLRIKPELDIYIVRAIIWTLSEERGALAVKWLAGESLGTQDAADLHLPAKTRSEKEREADALSTLSKTVSLIGEYSKVLICFDELDTIGCNSDGFPAQLVILDLVKKLIDLVQQSEKSSGIVFVTLLIPNSWISVTQDKTISIRKICTAYPEPIKLNYISPDTIEELVALWLNDVYKKRNFQPPTSIYPFDKDELTQYAKNKPDVRGALKWCSETLIKKLDTISSDDKILVPELSSKEKLENAYQKAMDQFSVDLLEDNQCVAEVLRFHFDKIASIENLKNLLIENVIVLSTKDVTPKTKNSGYLQFKILVKENGKKLSIAIGVLQQTSGLSVGAGFKRLLDDKQFKFNRGCMVRSKERKLKRNWDSYQHYQELVAKGGEWVDLKEEEFKPLFALKYIYDNCDQFNLTSEELNSMQFVYDNIAYNPLIKEILSNPAGEVHQEFLEGQELQHFHSEEESRQIIASLEESFNADIANDVTDQIDLGILEAE